MTVQAMQRSLILEIRRAGQNKDEPTTGLKLPAAEAHATQGPAAKGIGIGIGVAQREKVCIDMLTELHDKANSLLSFVGDVDPEDLDLMRQDPESRAFIEEQVEDILRDIQVLKHQCGDVLPARVMRDFGDLERRVRGALSAFKKAEPDDPRGFLRALEAIGQTAGAAASVLGGGILWLLQNMLPNPMHRN
jgi:hypothetical protein